MIGRDILGIADLSREDIETILETAERMQEIGTREVKKVPTLRGRTVINLFFEPSTRTQTSFEIAGKRLAADVVNFSVSGSSVSKRETLLDTAKTLDAMDDVGQHEDGDYILADDKQIIIKIIQEEIRFVLEKRKKSKKKKKKKSKGKKDACYRKVKSRYKVWPSAYASGALVKCRKVGAANWGNKSKKK